MEFDVFQVVPDEKRRVVRKSNYHPNISREVLILDDCDDEAFSPLLSPDIRPDNRLSESISRGAAAQEKFGKYHSIEHLSNEDKNNSEVKIIDQTDQVENTHENELDQDKFDHDDEVIILEVIN